MNGLEKLDLSALSLRDALDLAVLIEQEARDRYAELAQQLLVHHTPQAAAFFEKMSRAEELHWVQLAEQREKLFGREPSTLTIRWGAEVEAPDYDAARAFMSVTQALQVALTSEVNAHQFFTEALPRLRDPAVKQLFESLRDEEVEHLARVRAEMEKTPADPSRTEDYADDPVAQ